MFKKEYNVDLSAKKSIIYYNMTTKTFWKILLLTCLLATTGTALWLIEIINFKGWYSLNWLNETLYSPYLIILVSVFAFIVPFITTNQLSIKKITRPVILLYLVSLISYQSGKHLCYTLYAFGDWTDNLLLLGTMALIPFLLHALVYWYVTHRIIKTSTPSKAVYFVMFNILVVPLSMISILINSGFGSGTDWVDAVKMGYPVFWMTLMLGLMGIIAAWQKRTGDSD